MSAATCEFCNKTFSYAYNLTKHKKKHIKSGFVCTICADFYERQPDAVRHLKNQHGLSVVDGNISKTTAIFGYQGQKKTKKQYDAERYELKRFMRRKTSTANEEEVELELAFQHLVKKAEEYSRDCYDAIKEQLMLEARIERKTQLGIELTASEDEYENGTVEVKRPNPVAFDQ